MLHHVQIFNMRQCGSSQAISSTIFTYFLVIMALLSYHSHVDSRDKYTNKVIISGNNANALHRAPPSVACSE